MVTTDIFDIIFENANVQVDAIEGPHCAIKKHLRYYMDDIPDRPRYLYDADAVYFYNIDDCIRNVLDDKERRDLAERGDIMTSIWTPLTFYLNLNNPKKIKKNNENITNILDNYLTDDLFRMFNYLSENYASRGNLLLLPNSKNCLGQRRLNPDKFAVAEDKIDQFLFFCLSNTLIDYFDNNIDNVREWIISEHLECLFSNEFFQYPLSEIETGKVSILIQKGEIRKENLQSLINDTFKIETYKYSMFQEDDWIIYFERLNKVIAYRNASVFEPHFPFTWV